LRREIIGNCELYLGDCMDLMKQYPDNYFDLAIVDPPYGGGNTDVTRTGGTWASKYGKKIKTWDNPPDEKYFLELFRIAPLYIIWGGNYFTLPPSRNFIIWQKPFGNNFTMAEAEYAWTNIKGNSKIFKYPPQNPDRFHPCQKPIALYKWLLARYTKPGYKIIDTHMGSGSIAIACNEMNVNLTAIEIDADYFNAACDRIKAAAAQNMFDFGETPESAPPPQL